MLRSAPTRSFVSLLVLLTMATAQESAGRVGGRTALAATGQGADPAYEALLAHLADRPADVAKAIVELPSPATRARLQAAFGPGEQRPMAMLAVARLFPDDPEADLALLAAAAALLVHEERGEAVPELELWMRELGEDRPMGVRSHAALLPTIVALRHEIAARRARGGDAKVLDEAAALLAIASVSRGGGAAVQLRRDEPFTVPEDLGEPVELAWYPRELPAFDGYARGGHRLHWSELRTLGEPVQRALFAPRRQWAAPAVPHGHYLLAVRSQATPWWGVVPIEISNLDALAVLEDEAVVVAAWAEGHAAGAHFELTGRAVTQSGELEVAARVVALEAAMRERAWGYELRLASEFGPARLYGSIPGPERHAAEERWLVHTMVDRPLCRPGETLGGRIVLRRCTREGDGRMRVPTTTKAAACDVRVRFAFGDAGDVVCAGRTDEHGLFAFEVLVPEAAAPTGAVAVDVEVPDVDAQGVPLRIAGRAPFAIAHFELAAATLGCEGPDVLPEPGGTVEIAAIVRYASGAPVAGQLVHADVDGHTTALCTGPDGRATLRLPTVDWDAWRARQSARRTTGGGERQVVFSMLGPDGLPQTATHVVHDRAPAAAGERSRSWSYRHDEPRIDLVPAVVGQSTRIVVHGMAGARALLVVGRSRNARAFVVQFDEHGRAGQTVGVQRVDWPRLDVALVDRESLVTDAIDVTLGAVVAAAVELPATAAPGSEVACRVRSGRPGALVTLAVVDERLFTIEPDRTRGPTEALRPSVPAADWQRMVRARLVAPGDLLATMLEQGRVPELDERSFGPNGPSMGGPAAGMLGAGPPMRSDFRSAAHFATHVADADGTATFTVRMPSDLTTWRATAVVVDANGEGVLAQAATSTRVPWSVEPILPRGVRAGDAFALPLVVAHDAEAPGQLAAVADAKVEVAVRTESRQLAADHDVADVTVARGASRTVTVPMRALADGETSLLLELRDAAVLDRSERSLAIARDTWERPSVVAQRGAGTVRVPLPADASPTEGLVVDVLLGDAAVWSRLEQDLAVYPYGCAEQTLAKLLPYFAVARASARRGEVVPAMDEAFRRRLRAGLARLRQLRVGASQFAFWPGGAADPEISVLVKHGLAVLREAGVDLARERLDVAGVFVVPAALPNDADGAAQAGFALAVEEAAAALRLAPDPAHARQLAAVALPALAAAPEATGPRARAGLSAGATARLGLALLAAGDRDGAGACLAQLERGAAVSGVAATHAGEDPLAGQAMQLELRLQLGADAGVIERAVADLVLACTARRGSTYAQACAAAALALAVPPAAVREAEVLVEVAGERRTLRITSDRAETGRARFVRAGEVVVRGPAGASLLVRVTSVSSARASDHAAWRAPIAVERSVRSLPGTIDGAACARALQDPLDDALPRVQGPLPAGRPVLLVVCTTSPVPMRHVVIECPLPCGFELAGAARGVERHPAHVAFVADLRAGVPFEQRLLLVPTTVGRFCWPPLVASPMYGAGLHGGTAGAWVEVVEAPRGSEPSRVDWRAPAGPELALVASPRAAGFAARRARVDELRACWALATDGEPDPADLATRTACALGFDPSTTNPWAALAALDDRLDDAAVCRPDSRRSRTVQDDTFDGWLSEQLLLAFGAAMRTPIPTDLADAVAQILTAMQALDHVADHDEATFRRIALLRRAAAGAPGTLAALLDAMPTDPALAETWPGYLELLHTALSHEDQWEV